MANTVGPRGLVPSRYLSGSPYNGAVNMYVIPSTDGSIFGPGDVVKAAANGDANGIPAVQKATANDFVRGVIVSVVVGIPGNPSLVGGNLDLSTQAIPATKTRDYYVLVADDPTLIFEVQDDGAVALTATACNKNASLKVTNPTAPQQNSATTLDSATPATTLDLNLRIIGLAQKPNNAYGAYANWLVRFNKHELGQGVGTAGT